MLCQVYYGLTYEQEAELYYKLDQAKGHLRLSSATKALLESGSNAEIVDVAKRSAALLVQKSILPRRMISSASALEMAMGFSMITFAPASML